MANRRYLNFDLLLEAEGDGEYQARVIASPSRTCLTCGSGSPMTRRPSRTCC